MSWIALTVDDVENSLTSVEQGLMGDPSSAVDLNNIVVTVTNLVRGKVNSNRRNQGHMGPAGTIPDELQAAAVSIARFKFLTHLPGTQLITKERNADKDEAYEQLHQVATGELVIARWDDPPGGTPALGSDYGGEPFFEPYPTYDNEPYGGEIPYTGYPW